MKVLLVDRNGFQKTQEIDIERERRKAMAWQHTRMPSMHSAAMPDATPIDIDHGTSTFHLSGFKRVNGERIAIFKEEK